MASSSSQQKFLKNIRKGASVEELKKYVDKHPELLELIQADDDEEADLQTFSLIENFEIFMQYIFS